MNKTTKIILGVAGAAAVIGVGYIVLKPKPQQIIVQPDGTSKLATTIDAGTSFIDSITSLFKKPVAGIGAVPGAKFLL